MVMVEVGILEKEVFKRVYMVDFRGFIVKVNLIDYVYVKMRLLIFYCCFLFYVYVYVLCFFQNRSLGGVIGFKIRFVQEYVLVDKLVDVVKLVKLTVIIGKYRRSIQQYYKFLVFKYFKLALLIQILIKLYELFLGGICISIFFVGLIF